MSGRSAAHSHNRKVLCRCVTKPPFLHWTVIVRPNTNHTPVSDLCFSLAAGGAPLALWTISVPSKPSIRSIVFLMLFAFGVDGAPRLPERLTDLFVSDAESSLRTDTTQTHARLQCTL